MIIITSKKMDSEEISLKEKCDKEVLNSTFTILVEVRDKPENGPLSLVYAHDKHERPRRWTLINTGSHKRGDKDSVNNVKVAGG